MIKNARMADGELHMATRASIDGVKGTIERLSDGQIRVEYVSPQFNSMHGPGTDGDCSYLVHPCQRHQYEALNAQLPPQERTALVQLGPDERPWWSLSAGER